MRQATLRLL